MSLTLLHLIPDRVKELNNCSLLHRTLCSPHVAQCVHVQAVDQCFI